MTLRASAEPAWILHRRPLRDTSLILDVLTRHHGRVSLVSRGGRKAREGGLLQPFRPLKLDFVVKAELGSLHRFEADGPATQLSGTRLWCGFYVNELLMRLAGHNDTDDVTFFDDYQDVLQRLQQEPPAAVLRQFEYRLLCFLGFALNARDLSEGESFRWDPTRGLISAADGVPAHALMALLDGAWDERVKPCRAVLGEMLRAQLGARPLQSAAMLRELTSLQGRSAAGADAKR